MFLFFTENTFSFYEPNLKRMINTNNCIPFIIDNEGVLINEVNDFLLFKTEYDWNPRSNTPRTNAEYILHFLDFCTYSININWKNISTSEINQYIYSMNLNGNSENTIKCRLSSICSLFNWLFDKKYIKFNPFSLFSKNTVNRTIRTFINNGQTKKFNVSSVKKKVIKDAFEEEIASPEEIKLFYKCLSEEDKLMAWFLIETGVRKEELLQITTNMIYNMKESHTGKSYQLLLNASQIQIKYNKSRNIVLSKNLRNQLIKHSLSDKYKNRLKLFKEINTEKSPYLFISLRGNKYSTDKLNKSFCKASKESGYYEKHKKYITPHNLRHFFASNFIRRKELDGTDMESAYMYLSERLGHSSPDITKNFYVKIINKIKQIENIEKYYEDFISDFWTDVNYES